MAKENLKLEERRAYEAVFTGGEPGLSLYLDLYAKATRDLRNSQDGNFSTLSVYLEFDTILQRFNNDNRTSMRWLMKGFYGGVLTEANLIDAISLTQRGYKYLDNLVDTFDESKEEIVRKCSH